MRMFLFVLLCLWGAPTFAATMCIPDYSTYTDVDCYLPQKYKDLTWSMTCGDITISGILVRTGVQTPSANHTYTIPTNKLSDLTKGDGAYALLMTSPVVSEYVVFRTETISYGAGVSLGENDCQGWKPTKLSEFFTQKTNFTMHTCHVLGGL